MAYDGGSDPTLAELITRKFVPEIFSKDALMHTKSRLVCVGAFNHDYQKDLTMGYKASIPVFTEGTATEVTSGTEAVASDLAGTAVSVTVDNWYYSAAEISHMGKKEQAADYMAGAAKSCGYTIAKKIDTTVGVLFSTLASSTVYGADAQTFTDEIFRALVEALDILDVPDEERVLIGDPSTKRDMLDIDKFISTDYGKGGVIATGEVGTLYSAKVLITNNLTAATTGNYGVYAHKDAIGIVVQQNPKSNIYPMGWKFITKIVEDSFWGVDVIRTTFGKSFYTRAS